MVTSIIILTYNKLSYTIQCIDSIRKYTTEPYELIIVDNGSTDLTPTYLTLQTDIKFIKNDHNLGFAHGCNQGLAMATGERILFLNNDIIVTSNWLTNMLRVLDIYEDVGIVGPLTNYSSGHQQIAVTYTDILDVNDFATEHARKHAGSATEVRRIIGFCLLIKRSVLEEVGSFDERYGLGNFEDDDLCLRAANAGYRLFVVNDVFIHHFGHVTMNQLQQENLRNLLLKNRVIAQQKWGQDIFERIYKSDIKLTVCMKVMKDTSVPTCVCFWQSVADEIIVCNANEDVCLSPNIVRFHTTDVPTETVAYWRFVLAQATHPYVLFVQTDEDWSQAARRKIRALKRSLSSEIEVVLNQEEKEAGEERYDVRIIRQGMDVDQIYEQTEPACLRVHIPLTDEW